MSFSDDEIAYLSSPGTGRLATVDAEGRADAVPVAVEFDGTSFRVGGGATVGRTRKFRNVAAGNHKVCLVVDDLPSFDPLERARGPDPRSGRAARRTRRDGRSGPLHPDHADDLLEWEPGRRTRRRELVRVQAHRPRGPHRSASAVTYVGRRPQRRDAASVAAPVERAAAVSGRTTATGLSVWCSTDRLTEPSTDPRRCPRLRPPSTSTAAPWDCATSARSGAPHTSAVWTGTSGNTGRHASSARSTVLRASASANVDDPDTAAGPADPTAHGCPAPAGAPAASSSSLRPAAPGSGRAETSRSEATARARATAERSTVSAAAAR